MAAPGRTIIQELEELRAIFQQIQTIIEESKEGEISENSLTIIRQTQALLKEKAVEYKVLGDESNEGKPLAFIVGDGESDRFAR